MWGFRSKGKRDSPGGSVDEPACQGRNMGKIPGLGGAHAPWSNCARGTQLPGLRARARGPHPLSSYSARTPQPPKPRLPRACAPQREKPRWQGSRRTLSKGSLSSSQPEQVCRLQRGPSTAENDEEAKKKQRKWSQLGEGDCSPEIKRLAPWKESYGQPRQHIKKQRHYFASKGPSSQGYGFSSGHVWMWELDCEESWAPKNWCFWTVVLEKTLESPWDCKEIQPVHPPGD